MVHSAIHPWSPPPVPSVTGRQRLAGCVHAPLQHWGGKFTHHHPGSLPKTAGSRGVPGLTWDLRHWEPQPLRHVSQCFLTWPLQVQLEEWGRPYALILVCKKGWFPLHPQAARDAYLPDLSWLQRLSKTQGKKSTVSCKKNKQASRRPQGTHMRADLISH